MAQTVYRDPRTLQDLIVLQGESPTPPPQASSVVPVSTSQDTFTNPRDQRLYEMLTKPQDQGAAPTVDKKSTAGSIFKILGDAISTYASIQGRMPGLETHSFQKYLAGLERQQTDKKAYDERVAKANQEASLRGAEFLYTADEKRQMRADEQAGREQLKQMGIEQQKAEAKQRFDEADAKRAAEEAKAKQDHAWDVEMEKTRFSHEQIVAGIRRKASEGDDIAKDDHKKMSEIITHIGGLADVAKVALAGGDPAQQIPAMTPEQMNTRVRRLIDASQVSPSARKALEDYYNVEIGPTLRDFQMEQQNKDLAAGSPDASMSRKAYPTLERLGSVNVPQRY